jgi:ADP-heptose:LPS heptosyltransferase
MRLKTVELKGKEFLFRMIKLFFESGKEERLNPKDVDLSGIKKILVVRQDDRIGNLVLTTPLLSALRTSFPRSEIWYLASKTFHTLFSKSKLVDRILVAKKKQYIFHPLSLVSFIRKIRRQRFDLAIDASDENNFSTNNSFLVLLSGARFRIGYEGPRRNLFLNLRVPISGVKRYASEMHLDILRYLVGNVQSNGLKVEIDPAARIQAESFLAEKGVLPEDFLIGMHVGGRLGKRWSPENFRELADWVTKTFKVKVITFWGPEEKRAIRIFENAGSNQIISRLFPLPMLAALIERCNLFVSPDTGAMHLSAAVGTPTLALFLDSDHIKFGPRGKIHRIITASNGTIPVQTVKKAFEEMAESLSLHKT